MTQRGCDHSAIASCGLCEKDTEIERLRERNAEHEARYDALEAKEEYHKRYEARLRAALEKRLAEINARIAAHPYWGAALTALNEERRGLERAIANEQSAMSDTSQVSE